MATSVLVASPTTHSTPSIACRQSQRQSDGDDHTMKNGTSTSNANALGMHQARRFGQSRLQEIFSASASPVTLNAALSAAPRPPASKT